MLHTQIEHDEIVERYVTNRLTTEERQAFEEHYFACDECFEKLQAMVRFVAGVKDLAQHGALNDGAEAAGWRRARGWAFWAFAATSVAAIALAALAGWALLHRIPVLQQQLSAAVPKIQTQQPTTVQLQPGGVPSLEPEANVPLVMLQAMRGEEVTTAVVAPDARQLIVWVEVGPTRYRSYRMEVDSTTGRRIMTVDGLTRGPYGALAASLPAQALQPGTFRIRLIGETPAPSSLIGEYRLQIRTP